MSTLFRSPDSSPAAAPITTRMSSGYLPGFEKGMAVAAVLPRGQMDVLPEGHALGSNYPSAERQSRQRQSAGGADMPLQVEELIQRAEGTTSLDRSPGRVAARPAYQASPPGQVAHQVSAAQASPPQAASTQPGLAQPSDILSSDWPRLQAIMRKHQQAEQQKLENPPAPVAQEKPLPQKTLPGNRPPRPVVTELNAQYPAPQYPVPQPIAPQSNALHTSDAVGISASDLVSQEDQQGELPSGRIPSGWLPSEQIPADRFQETRFTYPDTNSTQSGLGNEPESLTGSLSGSQPASRSTSLAVNPPSNPADVVQAQADAAAAVGGLQTASGLETVPPSEPVAGPPGGTVATGKPMSEVLLNRTGDTEAAVPATAGAGSVQRMPLEAVWPFQQEFSSDSAPRAAPGDPANQPILSADDAESLHLRQKLESISVGQATDSRVEVITPRRPRPIPAAQGSQPETGSQDPGSFDPDGEALPDGLAVSDPSPGQIRVQTKPQDATQAGQANGNVVRTPPPEQVDSLQPGLVQTDIGLLPADLWQLLGENPPQVLKQSPEAGLPHNALQTRPADSAPAGVFTEQTLSNLPTHIQPPGLIQRSLEAEPSQTSTQAGDATQSTSPASPAQPAPAAPLVNTDELAQKVYAQLKRRLMVEWERLRKRFY